MARPPKNIFYFLDHQYVFVIFGHVDFNFETQGYLKKQENPTTFEHFIFIISFFGNPTFCQCSKRRAPKNDEDPFNKISKIMDVGSISIPNGNSVICNK